LGVTSSSLISLFYSINLFVYCMVLILVKDERIFHLFKVKCDVVSSDVGARVGSLIFMRNRV